ncbi:2-hydroxyglutaryl-CoA dehydratase [Clostridium botulinum]|uniref:acyl-CoA dehydratase activase n=1 Tax=Clostridium botulinum TaxID=1491 RepID=UPI0007DEE19B|nr:acyl-CoA dehydratase activase [Clostridium botulinum]AUN17611.1 2-hydroxyglutaryl-CoA dehydratase [Clostridium botulinum]KEI86932.1 2-hydroxyglutaryl-CoA dehydratase [Clostridium botulinum B2 267]MBY6796055.1 2-hydroxyglutaryl-CoA dehydratase [Clostridium botulinum]MBY6865015.1 2-hydroxyglutaryl-CoA dehydratase [Clostridium botulinum]MBY6997298.1 2-hydroxyglutaryl-CoA dehydratase [Clostridium botulinum]
MRLLGIDLGSREVKIVLMENNIIVQKKKVSTMKFYRDYCSFHGKIVVDLEKLNIEGIDKAISTGYGKNNTDLEFFTLINEIKAHVYGGIYQSNLKDFILLDVGGQDVKVVKVEKGVATDLELNEKCAASCGRYLENMANVLEISLDEMSQYSENPVDLNSTCAVFSESELIGKIAEGVHIERLCAGVNYSLYKRLQPLLSKFRGKKLVITGGVANNYSIKKYLNNDYEEIVSVKDPQFNGAIGCCYYGSKFLK